MKLYKVETSWDFSAWIIGVWWNRIERLREFRLHISILPCLVLCIIWEWKDENEKRNSPRKEGSNNLHGLGVAVVEKNTCVAK